MARRCVPRAPPIRHNRPVAIPQHFIQELLARADVVEIVGRYVQLKKTGANFSGLCPFHSEKSPSFTVSPSKQFYHCFGCGKNGNAIGFLMDHTGAGFVEVVHDLAQQYGMQVPEDERSPAERERAAQETAQRATLTSVLQRAADAYRDHLKHSPKAVAYLKQRGLSGQIAKQFGLGYAPEGWRALASVFPDYADPLLDESGLVITGEDDDGKRYDRFRDRVMFPIRSVKGDVIGFGGRVLGDRDGTSPSGAGPKYLNSPETPVFHKGRELYGLFEARSALREHGYALVTEGYMDVVALAQLGFGNAVATLGTACTPEHVQKLFRFTDSVVFSFDGDAAGRRAARKALDAALAMATDTRSIKFLFLPPEHDPDSFIRAEGAEAFGEAVRQATPLSRFMLEAATEGCDMASAEGRSHFAANARPLWQALPAGALAQQLLSEIAAQVQLGTHELEQLWGLQRPGARRAGGERSENRSYQRKPDGRKPQFSSQRPEAREGRQPGRPVRAQPGSRASRALQIVLTEPALWDQISQVEQAMLCDLPAPHGPLFVWLSGQMLDHGPQPWAALREAVVEQPYASVAQQVMVEQYEGIEASAADLRDILRQEHEAQIKRRMDAALAASDAPLYQSLTRELAALKRPQPRESVD